MFTQQNANSLVFASQVTISSKLQTYLEHPQWGSEGTCTTCIKMVNDDLFYSLQLALPSVFTHQNVNSFILHGTWWFVWLQNTLYYNDKRSSLSKSQSQSNCLTLAESPDMDPIELLWHKLKMFLHCVVNSTKKDKFVTGIYWFWESVTAVKCCKYISHLWKVIPSVVQCKGRALGY